MSLEDMERSIDKFLTIWLPWVSVVACVVSALYFGVHIAVWAVLRGCQV